MAYSAETLAERWLVSAADSLAEIEPVVAAAAAHETVMIKHQWTNGKIASYSLKLLGYQIVSGTADGFMQLKITGKQESDVTWSTATTVSG
ncbi:hypothetical protein SAMN02910344_02273 [Ruminobacter amylophilus]|uniref:Uncharacterized protein n=1 Tax=Ruminobacter amylophilus TaxID=867 RepID=A0A662ZKC9_9GAMM|nr:hypothetical protein [Ruminobacter amylophilus]SFP77299.1 hypothetical protein SAMN02910344_02273 [Ruminobacter amylophilus]